MQKTQETAAEAVAQRLGGFRFEGKRRVVNLQLFEGVLDTFVFFALSRINAAEHHGLYFFVARQRCLGRIGVQSDGIADACIRDLLDGSADIAYLSRAQGFDRFEPRRADADLGNFVFFVRRHHTNHITFFDLPVHDTRVNDDAQIVVIFGIEDQCFQLAVLIAIRRGHRVDDALQKRLDAHAGLGGDLRRVCRVEADDFFDLFLTFVRTRGSQIHLVEHRQDLQIFVQRQIDVRQSLRFHALRRVHNKHRALTSRERAGNLIGKVHMARRVNEIVDVFLSVLRLVDQPCRLQLDGDAALPFQIHIV